MNDSPHKDKARPVPTAYENANFIHSPDARLLRILSEYTEPLARFRRQNIQDTVVFFGSARVHSPDEAQRHSSRWKSQARPSPTRAPRSN